MVEREQPQKFNAENALGTRPYCNYQLLKQISLVKQTTKI